MIETALVFDLEGKTICFHEPQGRTSGSIPDTRSLWDILWENRERIGGVAHTHPWDGPAHPSTTDITTFDALERGLGKHLLWPVVTFTEVAYITQSALTPGAWLQLRSAMLGIGVNLRQIEIEGIEELRARSRDHRGDL